MPSIETSISFFVVALLLALSPGPDNLFVTMISVSQGRRAGVLVVLGLCTGLVIHTIAVAMGLTAIFASSIVAFTLLKFLGAAYLLFLAWQAWRVPVRAPSSETNAQAMNGSQLLGRGIIMNLTNPKVVLFFLAFLPQFVRTGAGPVGMQLVCFGLLFIVAAMIVFLSIACFAGYLGEKFRRSVQAQRLLNRLTACIFAGIAVRLVFTQR